MSSRDLLNLVETRQCFSFSLDLKLRDYPQRPLLIGILEAVTYSSYKNGRNTILRVKRVWTLDFSSVNFCGP